MELTNEILVKKFSELQNYTPSEKKFLYEALDFLQISYKRTNCKRCLEDYWQMCREELNLIESAAEESSFNSDGEKCYTYTCDRPQTWNGYVIDNNTPVEIIRKFIERFPVGYYAVEDCPHEDEPTDEYEGHKVVPHPDIV